MSNVPAGPGWWLASDGRWYPPETHPSLASTRPAASGAPSGWSSSSSRGSPSPAPSPGSLPGLPDPSPGSLPGSPPPNGAPRGSAASPWGAARQWQYDPRAAGPQPGVAAPSRLRAALDPRGVFVSAASAVVLAFAFLPWYRVGPTAPGGGAVTRTLMDPSFGGWRVAVPAIAIVVIVCGVVNSLLRAGDRGAVVVFVLLRLLTLIQLGLVIAAVIVHRPGGAASALAVAVYWPAWVALGASVVAVVGTLASASRVN